MAIVIRTLKYLTWVVLAAACATLATRLGPGKAFAAFAIAMAILCVAIALIVHRQPPQTVTLANYLMSFILPWGYRIGRGKLSLIVLTSWTIWLLIALAVVLAVNARINPAAIAIETSPSASANPRSATVMTLLALAWLIDGGVLLRCIGVLATSTNRAHMTRSLAPLIAFLLAILAASIALVTLNNTSTAASLALAIAGGPPLVVGVGYGLFVLVILTAGRNARWN